MRTGPALRALAMLALLLAAGAPQPAAGAGPSPVLCFNRDPAAGPTNPGSGCPGGAPPTPDYLLGDAITMRLHNVPEGVDAEVRVRCRAGCHEVAGYQYWAEWTGTSIRFPQDFKETVRPGVGRNAVADQVPRYNATWEATAFVEGQALAPREFNTWLFTAFRGENQTVHPGETHEFRAAGYEQTADIDLRIERVDAAGDWVEVPLATAPPTRAAFGAWWRWVVPPEEAVRIRECPSGVTHCYRVVLSGSNTSKQDETIPFRVATATARAHVVGGTDPDGTPTPLERTQTVDARVVLFYPGAVGSSPALTPDHLPELEPGRPRTTLRVLVEKTNATGLSASVVGEFDVRFFPSVGRWDGKWEIPRDLRLDEGSVYRVRLAEAFDKHGNRIPPLVLANHTISEARLPPAWLLNATVVPRTEEAVYAFRATYHNGTIFTDEHNATPVRGCFFRDRGATTPPCTNATANATATFEDGNWLFRVRYPRDYAHLGTHHFALLGGQHARDKWGNELLDAPAATFQVAVGSPRVNLTTAVRGHAMMELERGNRVSVSAVVTYADGTPFNHAVRENPDHPSSRVLNATLVRRGEDGSVQATETVQLHEYDASRGRWQGAFDLTLDDARTPLGRYDIHLDVADNLTDPNHNETVFHRLVVPAGLRVTPTRQPTPIPATGSTVRFDYLLQYPNCAAPDGCPVRPAEASSGVYGQVHAYDLKERTWVGEPVSGILRPEFIPELGVWSMRYQVSPTLWTGTYVIVVKGADVAGNRVPGDAMSKPFSPFSPIVTRDEVAPPAPAVRRGESATVTFAAQDGDAGPDGEGAPVIRVERWSQERQRWEPAPGASDVREDSEDVRDHLGVFHVRETTAIGTYRFVLDGRDDNLHALVGNSSNFTVEPSEVTRLIHFPPDERAEKGQPVWFHFEYRPGDRVTDAQVLHNLRPSNYTGARAQVRETFVNVSWTIPFDAPNGHYTIRIHGRDQYGNRILFDSPPVEATPSTLVGTLLGQPQRTVERGQPVKLLFGVTYPSGTVYAGDATPRAFVHNASGLVATAEVQRLGASYEATWTPGAAAGADEHWFLVEGEAPGGNAFPAMRSRSFQLAPGAFARESLRAPLLAPERLDRVAWSVPMLGGDRSVAFFLEYHGAARDSTQIAQSEPLTSTPVPHVEEPELGRYTVEIVTDERTTLGGYRLRMEGEDRYGNRIHAVSNGFVLQPTNLAFEWVKQATQADFREGAEMTLSFAARYEDGRLLREDQARLSAVVLLQGQVTNQQPELHEENGRWTVTWKVPDVLTPGTYTTSIRGTDVYGNVLSIGTSNPLRYEPKLSESFAKTVPGFDLALLAVGVAVALALAGRLRRRE